MVKRVALVLVLSLGVVAALYAANGFEQVTVAGTAIGFTASTIAPAGAPQMVFVACRVSGAQISFRYDGTTTVTSQNGTFLEVGDPLYLWGYNNLRLFRAIRTGATSGTLSCNFWDGHD